MKKAIGFLIAVVIIVGYNYLSKSRTTNQEQILAKDGHQQIYDYFANKSSGKMVYLEAVVINILSDDLYEPRHQRFIVELNNQLTVLVSHNIDLAPRVNALSVGDSVIIVGQYEWNAKGGVIHWTHHDPHGFRQGGKIIHKGITYE